MTTKPKITEQEALELAAFLESDDYEFSEPIPRDRWPTIRGRPSLTGPGTRSPQVTFRLDERSRQLAAERAAREGTTVSALAREALQRYLAS